MRTHRFTDQICFSRRSLLKTLLVFATGTFYWFSIQSNIRAQESKSLDSVSPNVTFTKLTPHSFTLLPSKQHYRIDIGELRQGKDYELEVVVDNKTGVVFKAIKARTSCNCLVGVTDGGLIDNGEKGSIVFRFSTRKDVFQQNVIIENEGEPVQLDLSGKIVPEFVLSPQRIDLKNSTASSSFEASFAPQYSDIDIMSVVVNCSSGFLSSLVTKRDQKEIKVLFTLERSMNTDVHSESIDVRFDSRDEESKEVRSSNSFYSLVLRSDIVVARPSIVRMSQDNSSSNSSWRGELLIYNLPSSAGRPHDQSIGLTIGAKLKVRGSIVEWIETKSITRVVFEIESADEAVKSIVDSRDWHAIEFQLEAVELKGMKCVFVR
ncbi:MAG: DUF1573 domain-containing protein [Pirellula sp.]|jgi:hypothetical protein|nr:DUF1573 domain-containing protein [Pirellula sp.]